LSSFQRIYIHETTIAFRIKVNGVDHSVDVDGDTPAALGGRDVLGVTGTKFGCGMALCGACMGTASASRAVPVRGRASAIEQACFGQSGRAGARRGDAPVHVAATRRYRSGA
jgi:hypothetical protein